jgi:hypothetical protein
MAPSPHSREGGQMRRLLMIDLDDKEARQAIEAWGLR